MKDKLRKICSRLKEDNSVKVKKSYYTFSKEYPAGNIPIKRKKNKKLHSVFLRRALFCFSFFLICCISFFLVRTALEISMKEPAEENSVIHFQEENLLDSEGVQALYMPYDKLGDTRYIKSFIKELRKKDCNSVVIQFKTPEGKLNYTSSLEYAIKAKASAFYNDTVRNAVSLFAEKEISVIAQIYCYEDQLLASACPELAVKYMDTDINWLSSDGVTQWLNPCLRRNQNYIVDIMGELYNLGIKGFILESCCYPEGEATSTATYPGESNFKSRNDALMNLFRKAENVLEDDTFVLIGLTGYSALQTESEAFGGSVSNVQADGCAVDLSKRDAVYTVDKKSGFSSMLSLFSLITANNPDKHFIPIIDISEYSSKYISVIKKSGYTNYIIYSENGEY